MKKHCLLKAMIFQQRRSITNNNNNNPITFEYGKMASLAHASVLVKQGSNRLLTACTVSDEPDYASLDGSAGLTVNFRHKSAAYGKIPQSHNRRDLPSTTDILTGRLIDRSLRPMLTGQYTDHRSINVFPNLLSVDLRAESSAIHVFMINGVAALLYRANAIREPVGAAGYVDDSGIDMVVVATASRKIVMLDVRAAFVANERLLEVLEATLIKASQMAETIGSLEKQESSSYCEQKSELNEHLIEEVLCKVFCENGPLEKTTTSAALDAIFGSVDNRGDHCREAVRRSLIEKGRRCDGRLKPNEMRKVKCEVALLDGAVHGSSLFRRGQTQVLSTLTLDSLQSMYRDASRGTPSPLILHYEFAPYCTGSETEKRSQRPNRRELGHGALAEHALRPTFPSDFTFTARVLCEVLESNGSSSMASVCAGSLALMDGAVPIKQHVAGVAMGLIADTVLTDINGMEDAFGEMDCKIAGSMDGVSAIQLDVKKPITFANLETALVDAQVARCSLIGEMSTVIAEPRSSARLNNQPIVHQVTIPPAKRSELIGVGGMNISRIQALSGVQISASDETTFDVFAPNSVAMSECCRLIDECLEKKDSRESLEFGQIYEARIVDLKPNGVSVVLEHDGICLSDTLAFLSSSQLDHRKVDHVSALGFKAGQKIQVKYFGVDPVSGAMRLSRKVLFAPPTSTRFIDPRKPR